MLLIKFWFKIGCTKCCIKSYLSWHRLHQSKIRKFSHNGPTGRLPFGSDERAVLIRLDSTYTIFVTYIPNKTILGQKVLATSKQQWNNVLDGRRPAMDSSLGQPPNVDSDAMSWRKPPVTKFFCHFYDYKNCLDKSRCCMKRNVHAMWNLCIQMTNQLFNLTLFMQSNKQVSIYMFYDICLIADENHNFQLNFSQC